ncbi:MAG: ornithine carbamoyltransferase [Thermoplasmata archaeon]
MPPASRARDILSVTDFLPDLPKLVARAAKLKAERRHGRSPKTLVRKSAALIFEKSSTRTRTSFEVGVHDLGGEALYLSAKDLQLGRGETIADTARVLSRYVDLIVYRAYRHSDIVELAKWASIPVINALDDLEHPCQIAADLLTLYEVWKGKFSGRRLAYIGDGNNVLHSLLLGAAGVGLDLSVATPPTYRPRPEVVAEATTLGRRTGAHFRFTDRPEEAARGADAVYTDVWVSMGDEAEAGAREVAFKGYQVNDALLDLGAKGAFAMHDLPAHRGQEITDAVMDGDRQVIWDQAENRLHAQKALIEWVFAAPTRRRSRH